MQKVPHLSMRFAHLYEYRMELALESVRGISASHDVGLRLSCASRLLGINSLEAVILFMF